MSKMENQIIECVPNFSEGGNQTIINAIAKSIEQSEGVKLLDVDPGKATNRTVMTFVGAPDKVINAAFNAMKTASELIDMRTHSGEHPRMGATDVCPMIPIANISLEETAEWAHKLGKRVGRELDFPVYMYESAATISSRKNLATVRRGEYEALPEKLKKAAWKPDYGQAQFNPKAGATAIGARDFLIAYNVNLNSTSVKRANSVAFDIRERGRIKRKGHPVTGTIVKLKNGQPARTKGKCKSVKAIGWFIEEYGVSQISMNLTNTNHTPLHVAFEACRESARKRGLRVTGSELVGLVPLKVMLDAGRFYLNKQNRSLGISEEETIHIAVKSLGLDEFGPFDPKKKIIEYHLRDELLSPLINSTLRQFANETASESPAPGGGSIAAYVGALGVALGTMVANLSTVKKGWEDKVATFSKWAAEGQKIKVTLLSYVDEDTHAFNGIIDAMRLPKESAEEKSLRAKAIQSATKNAIEVPLKVMRTSNQAFDLLKAMAEKGNPNSASDAGVGALNVRAAIHGAYLNVKINVPGLKDAKYVKSALAEAKKLAANADKMEKVILKLVEKAI